MILFSAILLNEEIKDTAVSLQEELKKRARGSYPRRENLHITTFYFGETAPETAERILEIMRTHPIPELEIRLDHIHCFSGRSGDHLIYAGTASEPLSAWHDEMKEVFKAEGIAFSEKSFIPHITLVRAKRRNVAYKDISVPAVCTAGSPHILLESLVIDTMRVYRPYDGGF